MNEKKRTYEYSRDGIKQSILRQAKSLQMQPGWAETVAERVAKATDKWIASKDTVTEADLVRVICKELKNISPDIAFAYKNRDKII